MGRASHQLREDLRMLLGDMCIEPLGLTVTQAAVGLGVSRKTLSILLNGHAGISPERAVRFLRSSRRFSAPGEPQSLAAGHRARLTPVT